MSPPELMRAITVCFIDSSSRSMRKVDGGEKLREKRGKGITTEIVTPTLLPNSPQTVYMCYILKMLMPKFDCVSLEACIIENNLCFKM